MSQNNTVSCLRSASFAFFGGGLGVKMCAAEVIDFISAGEILLAKGDVLLPDNAFGDDGKLVAH